MAERKLKTFPLQNRTDSMIGASMRIAGNVTFTGVLRIQGDVVGDIACDEDPNGTIVTDVSGKITGSIKSPRIVVRGSLSGPSHMAESIQVQQEGRIAGDLFYKEIEIHKGGVIEGHLTSDYSHDSEQFQRSDRGGETEVPVLEDPGLELANALRSNAGTCTPETKTGTGTPETRTGTLSRYFLGGAVLLVVIGLMFLQIKPFGTDEKSAMNNFALKTDSSMRDSATAQPAPIGSAPQPSDPQKDPSREARIVATSTETGEATPEAQPTSSPSSAGDPGKITVVQGVNPVKPDDFFWITAKEPAILLKKQREDQTEGKPIDVPQGKKISIAIGRNDIFRVIKGRNIEILFQGKKVGQKTIESGAWISFTPHADHR